MADVSARVVQCPKCAASLVGASAGHTLACQFCGTPLEFVANQSGTLIARVSSIDSSAAFLAKTEAVRRVRAQLSDLDASIADLQQTLPGSAERNQVTLPERAALDSFDEDSSEDVQAWKDRLRDQDYTVWALALIALVSTSVAAAEIPLRPVLLISAAVSALMAIAVAASRRNIVMARDGSLADTARTRMLLLRLQEEAEARHMEETELVAARMHRELAELELGREVARERLRDLENELDSLLNRL